MPVLVVGLILIALLVGSSLLQWALRHRQAATERRLPHVAELASLALTASEFPGGYQIDYRGPLTNERLAFRSEDEGKALNDLAEVGHVIGYRQAFRDPRSFGELVDVILNLTVRSGARHRMINLHIALFEDTEGAAEWVGESPSATGGEDSETTVRVADIGEHHLAFADSVRQWSRLSDATEVQRKIEARWRTGRLGCVVSGDSEPPGGIEAQQICDIARIVHGRIAASPLARDVVPATT
jgi:hypothetical protein